MRGSHVTSIALCCVVATLSSAVAKQGPSNHGSGQLALKFDAPLSSILDSTKGLGEIYKEIGPVTKCPQSWTGDSCNYNHYASVRIGKAKIHQRSQTSVEAVIPLFVKGHLRYRPEVAGIRFAAEYKPFNGRLTVRVRASVRVRNDWCLRWSLKHKVKWHKRPTVELPLETLDLSDKITEKVSKAILWAVRKDVNKSACSLVRNYAADLWQHHIVPFHLDGEARFLSIVPSKVKATQVEIENQRISMAIAIEVKTAALKRRPRLVDTPLPNVHLTKKLEKRFDITVPVQLPLLSINKQLQSAWRGLGGDTFEGLDSFHIKLGKLKLSVARGVLRSHSSFVMRHKEETDERKGTLDFGLRPVLSKNGRSMHYQAADLDNPLLVRMNDDSGYDPIVHSILNPSIQKLPSLTRFKARDPFAEMVRAIERGLTEYRPESGIRFSLRNVAVNFASLPRFKKQGVEVAVRMRGTPTVDLTAAVAGWVRNVSDLTKLQRYKVVGANTLNVRPQPGLDAKMGKRDFQTIDRDTNDIVLHECRVVAGSDYEWCRISAGQIDGWVNAFYLARK